MRTATFYPVGCSYIDEIHSYKTVKRMIDSGLDIKTTQMCMLNHVKDYDLIRIVNSYDDVIEIANNHDGTYSCDRTDRVLRRANSFFHLWENGEFDV